MQTNSPAQQRTRHMTPAAKAAVIQQRIEADRADRIAHEARFRTTRELWLTAEQAGLTQDELHALDMELAHGADVQALLAELRQF